MNLPTIEWIEDAPFYEVLERSCNGGAQPKICSSRFGAGFVRWWLVDQNLDPPITGDRGESLDRAVRNFARQLFHP